MLAVDQSVGLAQDGTSAELQRLADSPAEAMVDAGRLQPGTRMARSAGPTAARGRGQRMPTLFDRLRNEAPSQAHEAATDYTVTPNELRSIIQRDLAFLLNATNAEDLIDRDRYPEAAASTVNFGVPPLAGAYASERKWDEIERVIRRAITDFEPRLIPESLSVMPLMKKASQDHYNVLVFEIRAMVASTPYPLALTVQSAVDLETNRMSLIDTAHTTRTNARGLR